ncbi:glycerophosphodiester phosphodiesterase [Priestia flexa]|uniref:glycerophosphodiester phosphodiesterase n=1 Tax=Priestia flexa TaxID=86664 RepID=UPI00220A4163|nr:glycerophosphodiester phosphodiesterase family protein [Priestia flexa]MDT2048001.1 glycerophosphodiester phosphodiesterase family protein [Priestia flexa]USY55913.1 glycerophosphodiester phosphodiesterase [Bacillus sp. 1780r2a1]
MNKKVLAGVGISFALLLSPLQQASAAKHDVDNVAHRGASGYAPENTIAAFDKAFEMKSDYIEIDVQQSKDGELVVIHDLTVDRTTNGTGSVKDLTLEELQSLDAGSWKGTEFAGEPIPTFEEILDRYRGKIGILIELKSPELYPGIEAKIADELKESNMDKPNNEKIIVQSFNFDSMKKMDQLLPSVPIGVLTGSKADITVEKLQQFATYADYFNPHYGLVTSELVTNVHNNGMKISSWTVRNQQTADFLLSMNVDAIITDFPDYVQK